ncbi:helix-turn-helix domain-containing protein [Salmonella enterica]|nr:helix-turn-helix domain-containing protein [Salmonella enterica]EHL6881119.1 helix-turn-helix domain-containing protein [Salmonella enterica]EHL6896091.1 helix-turn-helix domain-containing protein [Salmonella enterica]EHL6909901.1 helix-turn-helix domain-containing protein [Salmonella enterica]EIB2628727.1 helix-turn-helix domain-containing protein [Salmonella enterica]
MKKENEKIAASRLNDEIAMRLKERRQKLGLSQGKLAEICGWTQSRIGNYEAGSRNVGVYDAVVLGEALSIPPPELLFGEKDSSQAWLSEHHKKLLELFNQLPSSEQQRMIDLFEIRLKEIDDYVETYLRNRLKNSTQPPEN